MSDSYERATELERIGGELLAYQVPKTLLSGQQPVKPMRNVTPDLPRLTVVK
ncbi:hypothetical protein [Megasphaera sueciensis]|uniref:hypothetical protein n=1 Tax=Megasphaera sueciensis TaxID=349094 RepID=UPI003D01C93E